MARQSTQAHWMMRPVVVLLMLLVSLDFLLVGLALINRSAHPALSRRFAAEEQAAALDSEAERARRVWEERRKRFEQRAAASRPKKAPNRVEIRKGVERVSQ